MNTRIISIVALGVVVFGLMGYIGLTLTTPNTPQGTVAQEKNSALPSVPNRTVSEIDSPSSDTNDAEDVLEATAVTPSPTQTPVAKPPQTTTAKPSPTPASPVPTPTPAPTPAPTPKPSGYTMAEVATHSGSASCWSVINGSVYDLTSYVSRHPGGERKILNICGKDGTSAFLGQHGGESKPENILAGLRIGAQI